MIAKNELLNKFFQLLKAMQKIQFFILVVRIKNNMHNEYKCHYIECMLFAEQALAKRTTSLVLVKQAFETLKCGRQNKICKVKEEKLALQKHMEKSN